MNDDIVAAGPSRGLRPAHWVALASALAIAGALALATSSSGSRRHAANDAESAVVQCDRLARAFTIEHFANTLDRRSAQWRREREAAFRTCLDDPRAFERQHATRTQSP